MTPSFILSFNLFPYSIHPLFLIIHLPFTPNHAMSSFFREDSCYPPAIIALDPYASDTSPHSVRLPPADFLQQKEVLPVCRTKTPPPELSRQEIIQIRRALGYGRNHPAGLIKKATTTIRRNNIFDDSLFYQGLSRPPRIAVEHQMQYHPAPQKFPCLIPLLHPKKRFWISVEATPDTTPVYFDTHLVSANDDVKDAKEVFDELVTTPRLYGFDEDREDNEGPSVTIENLANRDVSPCEGGIVTTHLSRLSRISPDPRHRLLPDVDLEYNSVAPLIAQDARLRRGYEHDAIVTESEFDEDEVMDVVDSSDEGDGSGDDLDYDEWWQHDAAWGQFEVGPFDCSLGTMEYLFR